MGEVEQSSSYILSVDLHIQSTLKEIYVAEEHCTQVTNTRATWGLSTAIKSAAAHRKGCLWLLRGRFS